MSYYMLKRPELLQKAKDRCHNSGGKEKAAEYYIALEISIEICQKKKKKQKKNMEEIGTKI